MLGARRIRETGEFFPCAGRQRPPQAQRWLGSWSGATPAPSFCPLATALGIPVSNTAKSKFAGKRAGRARPIALIVA